MANSCVQDQGWWNASGSKSASSMFWWLHLAHQHLYWEDDNWTIICTSYHVDIFWPCSNKNNCFYLWSWSSAKSYSQPISKCSLPPKFQIIKKNPSNKKFVFAYKQKSVYLVCTIQRMNQLIQYYFSLICNHEFNFEHTLTLNIFLKKS